jgi:hypothetical protein
MTLVAPLDGTVTTPYLETMEGTRLAEGGTFCEIADLSRVRLDVSALESDLAEIGERTEVRILAAAHPTRPSRARVLSVNAATRAPQGNGAPYQDLVAPVRVLRVLAEIDNEEGLLRPGMSGRAQFLGKPRSLAGNIAWRLGRWLSTLVW